MNAFYSIGKKRAIEFCQSILFDDKGKLVNSCDTIFSTKQFSAKQQKVQDWFTFLESVMPIITTLKEGDPEILFTKVQSPSEILPGFYDFSFTRVILKGESFILWLVYDYTQLYNGFLQYQQAKNEIEIQRQIFEANHKKISKPSDVFKHKNYFKETYNDQLINSNYVFVVLRIIGMSFPVHEIVHDFGSYQGISNHLEENKSALAALEKEFFIFLGEENEALEINFLPTKLLSQVFREIKKSKPQLNISLINAQQIQEPLFGKANVIAQVLYSLLINTMGELHFNVPEISMDLEYDDELMLITTVGQKIKNNHRIDDYLIISKRLHLLKLLIKRSRGKLVCKYEAETEILSIIFKIPIKKVHS